MARLPYPDATSNSEISALAQQIRAQRGGPALTRVQDGAARPARSGRLVASLHRDPSTVKHATLLQKDSRLG
jgi:hypothetical protein